MDTKDFYLLAGLGNPGTGYEQTRHNAGFMVIDRLAEKFDITLSKKKFDVSFGSGTIAGKAVILAKPMAFMNRSGPPLLRLANFYKISSRQMMVIHDDIDLAYGKIKIKTKGGHGGHKGIKSIVNAFGSNEFVRIRVGIDHPGAQDGVVDHVLGRFSESEKALLPQLIDRAGDAAVEVLERGAEVAMNRLHRS
ncbi:MAG: aminoacyl-tRNA hydrolase [Thermodesulfobacteriota bacterium]|nr:aminoacyl-tRNA hydrolase [Thermodesulfobacteriota bacterium]